jgi:LysM repeat protein
MLLSPCLLVSLSGDDRVKMSQSIVFILLMFALVLPVIGAVTLRIFAGRLRPGQMYGAAAAMFAVAIASVLMLARSDIPSIQVFNVTLLLPASAADTDDLALPVTPQSIDTPTPSAPPAVTPTSALTATTIVSPTITGTTTATATSIPPTVLPTETPVPTAEPPTPTPEPPTAAPAGPRTYTVQPGDTLRSIAEQFNVSVQALIDANNLTPEQADSLRVGQELIIP